MQLYSRDWPRQRHVGCASRLFVLVVITRVFGLAKRSDELWKSKKKKYKIWSICFETTILYTNKAISCWSFCKNLPKKSMRPSPSESTSLIMSSTEKKTKQRWSQRLVFIIQSSHSLWVFTSIRFGKIYSRSNFCFWQNFFLLRDCSQIYFESQFLLLHRQNGLVADFHSFSLIYSIPKFPRTLKGHTHSLLHTSLPPSTAA